MATNPMQRKARNSFLIGFIVATLIIGAIAAFLAYQLVTVKKEQAELEATYKTVYILKSNIESGKPVTIGDCTTMQISSLAIPKDYISATDLTEDTIAKVDLSAGTILSASVLIQSGEELGKDVRVQEYNMITLPTQLEPDSYIDIRLTLPNGQDYIVVSKKRVIDANADTVWLNMTEEETLIMTNAIVESYIMTGAKLYAVEYVEAGMQDALISTYIPNGEVLSIVEQERANGNLSSLSNRYTEALKSLRERIINAQVGNYSENATENVEKGVSDEKTKLQNARAQYFDSLNATN